MGAFNGVTVPTFTVTDIALLPTGDSIPTPSDVSLSRFLSGNADAFKFRWVADGGDLVFSGLSSLAIYDLKLDKWSITLSDIGVESRVVGDGEFMEFDYRRQKECNLMAIVMPNYTDAGTGVITVTERFKRRTN